MIRRIINRLKSLFWKRQPTEAELMNRELIKRSVQTTASAVKPDGSKNSVKVPANYYQKQPKTIWNVNYNEEFYIRDMKFRVSFVNIGKRRISAEFVGEVIKEDLPGSEGGEQNGSNT